MSEIGALQAAIEKARAEPGLGRSAHIRRLFEYLAACSLEGRSPKETEVAIEVFGRDPDFDPARDAIARVYVHKLRQRLDTIDDQESGLTIPRGEYRLALRAQVPAKDLTERGRPRLIYAPLAGAAFLLMLALGVALWGFGHEGHAPAAARTQIWQSVIGNGRPTLIVIGDYYIFGDINPDDGSSRLVREYTVNSNADLDRFILANPKRAAGYMDLGLHYLPVGSASALMNVAKVLADARDVRAIPISSLTPTMMRDDNIVYIGYFSALGLLRDPAFAGSRYEIGETYDDIVDTKTERRFESGGGGPERGDELYADYGYLSSFDGPTGNHYVIIAGTRDAALTQMGQSIINAASLNQVVAGGGAKAVEALYGVKSLNQINFDSQLIRASPMRQDLIWDNDAQNAKAFPAG